MDSLVITDGLTTVDLAGGGSTLIEYNPRGPVDPDSGVERGVVAERAVVAFAAGTLALALAQRDALERLLRQAARVLAGSGEARVFVQGKREADLPLWRSEILSGGIAERDGDGYWPERGLIRATLSWNRRPFWEAEEAEIPLLGTEGGPETGGQIVACGHAPRGGGANFVDLYAVAGSLPAPLRLEFTNLSTEPVKRLWVGLHVAPGAQMLHTLDSEFALSTSGGVRVPADGEMDQQYSVSACTTVNWAVRTATKLMDWDIDRTYVGQGRDRWYRGVARWSPAPAYTNLLVQMRVTLAGEVLLWAGPWMKTTATRERCELGTFRLPPMPAGIEDLEGVRVELWGKRDAAGSHALNVDYLLLMPVDGTRRFESAGAGLAQNAVLIDDAPVGLTYTVAGGVRSGDWITAGEGLNVHPGQQHRLVLFWENASGVAAADKAAMLLVRYRRRVVVP